MSGGGEFPAAAFFCLQIRQKNTLKNVRLDRGCKKSGLCDLGDAEISNSQFCAK